MELMGRRDRGINFPTMSLTGRGWRIMSPMGDSRSVLADRSLGSYVVLEPRWTRFDCLDLVRDSLRSASILYPGLDEWLRGPVAEGLTIGTRSVFLCRHRSDLLGVAIAKRTTVERKLCTLWVTETARGLGIASILAAYAFEWLGTDRPLFTVAEERIGEFRALLNAWRFSAYDTAIGQYRQGKREYVFNGALNRESPLEHSCERPLQRGGILSANFMESNCECAC